MTIRKNKLNVIVPLLVLSALGYLYFGYKLDRAEFIELVGLYTLLFTTFLWLTFKYQEFDRIMVISSFVFRGLFLLSLPNLSQDFFRFIWDGRLILEGINPYSFSPDTIISEGKILLFQSQELYDGMGSLSAGNHTNYPPLNQLCFAVAGLVAGKSILGSVVVMRLIIIAADMGIFFFGRKLLGSLSLPKNLILLYLLNPFIIIELTGNLHFEGVMIFFLIWSLYLLHKGKWLLSAGLMACSISVKLLPLMFLPILIQRLGLKSIRYYLVVGVLTTLSFLPFYSPEFVSNFSDTVALWFQKFEFNASLYYIAREIGYGFRGYNEIAIIGSYIPFVVVGCVLLLSLFRNNRPSAGLITGFMLALAIYFFCSTTVHPWYIATLLALSIFTKYRFPLVWSLVIMLSYWAYSNEDYEENYFLIALEYGVVWAAVLWDIIRIEKNRSNINPATDPELA